MTSPRLELPPLPDGVTVTYQQQRRKCGKPTCDCRYRAVAIHGHGPYWYAYWRDRATGRMRSRYIGKHLPEALASGGKRTPTTSGKEK